MKATQQSRGRPRSFDHEEVILKVMNAFWKDGYENVSMDQLCKITHLSKPSFYNAYESKEKLFCLCLAKYQSEFASPLLDRLLLNADPMSGYQDLLKYASKQFRDPKTPTGCLVLTGAIEAKGKTKVIDQKLLELQRGMLQKLEAYFKAHISKNKSGASARAIAQFAMSQLYALAMFSRTSLNLINFEEFNTTSCQLMKGLLI